jgi:hypothetical protein
MEPTLSEQKKISSDPRPRREDGSADPTDSGIFRWYQDLLDRILPKEKKKSSPDGR